MCACVCMCTHKQIFTADIVCVCVCVCVCVLSSVFTVDMINNRVTSMAVSKMPNREKEINQGPISRLKSHKDLSGTKHVGTLAGE